MGYRGSSLNLQCDAMKDSVRGFRVRTIWAGIIKFDVEVEMFVNFSFGNSNAVDAVRVHVHEISATPDGKLQRVHGE